MRIDFSQQIVGFDKKPILTNPPARLVFPLIALEQLDDDERKKYDCLGQVAKLKPEFRTYLTLKDVAVESLNTDALANDEQKKLDYRQRLERGRLAERIYDSNGSCEVTTTELDLIKALAAQYGYMPEVIVCVDRMIESLEAKKADPPHQTEEKTVPDLEKEEQSNV